MEKKYENEKFTSSMPQKRSQFMEERNGGHEVPKYMRANSNVESNLKKKLKKGVNAVKVIHRLQKPEIVEIKEGVGVLFI